MPGKSKKGKGKRPQNRNRVRQPVAASAANTPGTQSGAPAGTAAPVAPAAVNIASAPTRAPKGAAAKAAAYNGAMAEQYPYITSELKRIAVITAIMLVILIVLALVIR